MAAQTTSFLSLILVIFSLFAVMALQNHPTHSTRLQEETVLSASAFSGFEKTSKEAGNRLNGDVHRTLPAVQLESSKDFALFNDDFSNYKSKRSSADKTYDVLLSSKFVEQIDGNNIEVKPGEYLQSAPTESIPGEERGAPQGRDLSTEPQQPIELQSQPERSTLISSDLPRQARKEIVKIYKGNAFPSSVFQTSPAVPKQANPDIQDIITGIVKLLNGNVNVAVNTAHQHRPVQATRINNRGPPRISDVPPLPPDFDTPGMSPPPLPDLPHVYEKPPAPNTPSINQLPPAANQLPIRPFLDGVPLPEQLVPLGIHPWNRPGRPTGGAMRRPNIPYKPATTYIETDQVDQQLRKNSTDSPNKHLTPNVDKNLVTIPSNTRNSTVVKIPEFDEVANKTYHPPLKTSSTLPENTLMLGVKPQTFPIMSQSETTTFGTNPINPVKTSILAEKQSSEVQESLSIKDASIPTITPETLSRPVHQTTLKIETSSSVNVIDPTPTIMESQPTVIPLYSNVQEQPSTNTMLLEPSKTTMKNEFLEGLSSSSTPTEVLPTVSYKTTESGHKTTNNHFVTSSVTFTKGHDHYHYRPRPGIVLDDTLDYTGAQSLPTQKPYVPQRHPINSDTFDVVVSASHGPAIGNSNDGVKILGNSMSSDVILTSAVEGQGFVSIDGKRTYLNLFDNTERVKPTKNQIQPTRVPMSGTGFAVAQADNSPAISPMPNTSVRKPVFNRRPTQPPVRIDTCIVGDTSTCDASQHEACATIQGVSACHCKPGFARLQHNLPCKRIVSIVVSIRVDQISERKIIWSRDLGEKDSDSYQTLAYEATRAIESAMSMTPFSDEYIGSSVNNIYQGDVSQGQGGVYVNATLKLAYEPRTARPSLAGELQKHLLGVIHRRNNNIGNSALYVDSPTGSISNLQDLDECGSSELNDCHSSATCTNTWGGFTCACKSGFKDPHKNDLTDAGRTCLSCPSTHCNNRGTCSYQKDQMQCSCTGNYYGTQCEIDGEVLGVAIGASVAALIIIVLTLVCLVMWSRRWSREQKCLGSPVYGYMQNGIPATLARVGSMGTLTSTKQGPPSTVPPYLYPHVTEHMATANVYATEPMGQTRPSSTMFGYPTLNMRGTLPPVPLPRLQAPSRTRQRHQQHHLELDSSDSEPQDKDRADLIPQSNAFNVPRPKSRTSLANQSGIYYDVEYDQGDSHHLSKNNIPMSTYSMARPYYRT